MTFLSDPFAGTVAARDTSVAWLSLMGIPQQTDGVDQYDSLESYSKAPADEAWVFSCVQRIFNAAASVPLRVYVKVGKDLVPAADEPSPEGDDLQYLLDNVNPIDMTGSEMKGYTAASRKVWGGWYWYKVRGRYGGATQELYWLRVPDVKPVSRDGRSIDWYDYNPTARTGQSVSAVPRRIETRDMIRKRGINMRSQIEMLSPLSSARYDMVVDQAAPLHTASMLKRRGVPEGYWSAANPGVEITNNDKSAIRRWLRQLTGPRNAGKSLVAPDIKFNSLGLPEKDAEWLAARKVSRMTVCAVLGVPLALAGDDEHAAFYRSAIDAQRVFWKDTNVPELDGDADSINNWLTPEFRRPGGPYLVVAYDFSQVEALKPAWIDEWNGWLGGIDRQAITPNRFIRHFRLGEDVPWGDNPVPRTTVTLRDSTFVAPPVEEAPAGPSASEMLQPDSQPGDEADLPAALRAIGKRLYQQTAVRGFVAHGGPLDTESLLRLRVPDNDRLAIEDGLRRRWPAERIADALSERIPA